jgi:hypothetical protein
MSKKYYEVDPSGVNLIKLGVNLLMIIGNVDIGNSSLLLKWFSLLKRVNKYTQIFMYFLWHNLHEFRRKSSTF